MCQAGIPGIAALGRLLVLDFPHVSLNSPGAPRFGNQPSPKRATHFQAVWTVTYAFHVGVRALGQLRLNGDVFTPVVLSFESDIILAPEAAHNSHVHLRVKHALSKRHIHGLEYVFALYGLGRTDTRP